MVERFPRMKYVTRPQTKGLDLMRRAVEGDSGVGLYVREYVYKVPYRLRRYNI